jgi:hypothetical protein
MKLKNAKSVNSGNRPLFGLFIFNQQFKDATLAMGPAAASEMLASATGDLFAIGMTGGRVAFEYLNGFFSSQVNILPKVEQIMKPFAQQIAAAYSDAQIGIRGSLARGASYNKATGGFKPSNSDFFDVDAFIVSDRLAAKYGDQGFRRAAE